MRSAPAADLRRFECRLSDGDLPQCWVVTRGLIVYERERSIRLVGSLRDITDFKRAVVELRESEMRVRAILDTAFEQALCCALR
jgi:PAS domain-containing protein